MYPEDICEELMTRCLAPDFLMGGLGGDNMTVVLVCFLHNKPYENLVSRCEAPIESLEYRKIPELWPPRNGSTATSDSSDTTPNVPIGPPRIRKEDSDDDDGDDDLDNEPNLK